MFELEQIGCVILVLNVPSVSQYFLSADAFEDSSSVVGNLAVLGP